jgi:hypothetical protein
MCSNGKRSFTQHNSHQTHTFLYQLQRLQKAVVLLQNLTSRTQSQSLRTPLMMWSSWTINRPTSLTGRLVRGRGRAKAWAGRISIVPPGCNSS